LERITATGSIASDPGSGEAAAGTVVAGGADGSCGSVIRYASLTGTTRTFAAM
jgi:hypothetical protein